MYKIIATFPTGLNFTTEDPYETFEEAEYEYFRLTFSFPNISFEIASA